MHEKTEVNTLQELHSSVMPEKCFPHLKQLTLNTGEANG